MIKNKLSRDGIKLIAVLAMLVNHIANMFVTSYTPLWIVMTSIGYITAITMCFFLVEGVRYTRSPIRYALRLLGFGLLSQGPFAYCFERSVTLQDMYLHSTYNMLFTLLLCFTAAQVFDRVENRLLRTLLMLVLVVLSTYCDWPVMAVCFTWLFLDAQSRADQGSAAGRRVWAGAYVRSAVIFCVFEALNGWVIYIDYGVSAARIVGMVLGGAAAIAVSGVLTLVLYNGRRGSFAPRLSKWFFYAFYPGHLIVLALIRWRWFG